MQIINTQDAATSSVSSRGLSNRNISTSRASSNMISPIVRSGGGSGGRYNRKGSRRVYGSLYSSLMYPSLMAVTCLLCIDLSENCGYKDANLSASKGNEITTTAVLSRLCRATFSYIALDEAKLGALQVHPVIGALCHCIGSSRT